MPRKRIAIDPVVFIADYIGGKFTVRQLAARHGISESLAGKIIRGERRPELAKLIDKAIEAYGLRIQRRLTALRELAVKRLERAVLHDEGSLGLAAAKEILNRTMPDKPAKEPRWPYQRPPGHSIMMELSPETKRRVLKELGGPLD